MSTPSRQMPSADATPARWIRELRFEDVPANVVARAEDLLLDTLAVAIGSRRVPAATLAAEHAASQFAAGTAEESIALPFDGRPVSTSGAVYALATGLDNLDAHDGYQPAKGHAGVAVVPALLALAARHRPSLSGHDALAALVVGYEIACRAGVALHGTAGDYHSSGAWNALGVAALGCNLLGIEDRDRIEAALGIAEYHAPRAPMMREIDHPSMLHDSSGWGALAGLSAVELARSGFEASAADLLHAPAAADHWRDLGTTWLLPEQYVKAHPVCFWAQPAVRAALELRRRHEVDPGSIERITIATFHEATRLWSGIPANTARAQYSLAFPVACALHRGQVGPDEIAGSGLTDEAVRALVERIGFEEREDFNARFPAERVAAITLSLADGTRLESGPCTPLGTPDEPLDRAAIERKLAVYAEDAWPADRQAALIRAIQRLHEPDARFEDVLALCTTD